MVSQLKQLGCLCAFER